MNISYFLTVMGKKNHLYFIFDGSRAWSGLGAILPLKNVQMCLETDATDVVLLSETCLSKWVIDQATTTSDREIFLCNWPVESWSKGHCCSPQHWNWKSSESLPVFVFYFYFWPLQPAERPCTFFDWLCLRVKPVSSSWWGILTSTGFIYLRLAEITN